MSDLSHIQPGAEPIPAFAGGQVPGDLRQAITQAVAAWLLRTPSPHTRKAYEHDAGAVPRRYRYRRRRLRAARPGAARARQPVA